MQTSDQSPEEQRMVSQPSPEPEISPSPPVQKERGNEQNEQSTPGGTGIDDEAIRQGLIYPPPPSFYQKEQSATNAQTSTTSFLPPPSQAPYQSQEPPHTYGGPAEYIPPQQPNTPAQQALYRQYPSPTSYPGQGHPGGQAPYFAPMPSATKKSYKWVWILVSVLGVLLLAICGVCAWASSSLFGDAFQQANSVVYGGRDLTNNYYEAIQSKHYSQAYSYLYPQQSLKNLSMDQYLKQAQDLDAQYGPVNSYTQSSPSISYDTSNTTIDHFTITVNVTRAKKSYQTVLTIYKINNQWKITDYTTI